MTPRHVVMIGTDPATRGGISSALAAWDDAGLFDRWPISYIPTHRDGTRVQKALRAVDAFVTLLWLATRYRHALLHVHSASRNSFWRKAPFMAVALLLRWQVVFHLHGGGFSRFYERECGPVRRAVVRFFLRRATRIVAVSPRWAQWLRDTFGHPHVESIPNAVPLPRVSTTRLVGRIAFSGRLSREKGAFDLVEALARVRVSHPEVRLEMAGDGDTDALARHARAFGVSDRVLIRGWCDKHECERMLARAAVFALPSHVEGLPMSLLEAMAAGCTVVATHVGGTPDLVVDEGNGLLVPPGDVGALASAIARALSDRPFAATLAQAARETVARRHAPAAAVQRIGRIYYGLGVEPATAQPQGIPA